MLDLYRWEREHAYASERLDQRARHAYVMDKEETGAGLRLRERAAGALHQLAFHLAPNQQWSREVAA